MDNKLHIPAPDSTNEVQHSCLSCNAIATISMPFHRAWPVQLAYDVLQDSPIIILDEATSSLDAKTERLMSEAIDRLTKGRTTIVVAHRLSTIQAADNIVMLEDGVAVEQGTHEDLISRPTRYKDLVSNQSLTLRR